MVKPNQNHENQKELTYYQTLLSAFVGGRLEYAQRILTLSVLAVGFLVSFLAILQDRITDSIADSWYVFALWLCANIFFISAIFIALRIFREDDQYILKILQDQSRDKKALENYSKSLYNEKKVIAWVFLFGIIFAFAFVLAYAIIFLLIATET